MKKIKKNKQIIYFVGFFWLKIENWWNFDSSVVRSNHCYFIITIETIELIVLNEFCRLSACHVFSILHIIKNLLFCLWHFNWMKNDIKKKNTKMNGLWFSLNFRFSPHWISIYRLIVFNVQNWYRLNRTSVYFICGDRKFWFSSDKQQSNQLVFHHWLSVNEL